MQEVDNKPWYKQFWPWFLMAIPLSSVIVGSQVIRLAYDGTNSLVADDYYKEGRAINARIDKVENAIALNIKTTLDVQTGSIVLEFISGAPETGEALVLDFFHVTQEFKDFTVLLTRDASGIYRNNDEYPIAGKWRIRLHPIDNSWKVQNKLNLPQRQAFEFNP